MINGYDDFDVGDNNDDGDNVNDDVLIRRRPVQFSVTSSSAGQLKSPQTFFVCRSVAPSHFRSSSLLNAFIFSMYLYCHVSMYLYMIFAVFVFYYFVFAHSHLPTSYALPHSSSKNTPFAIMN